MLKQLFSILIAMNIFWGFAQADEESEKADVQKVIENYFDGYNRGDVELLKKTFHPDVLIKYIDLRSGEYTEFSMPAFNDFMSNLPKDWESVPKLYSIDVHGTAAQAKVSVTVYGGALTWVDYISLLKIDGTWMIVGKISHGDRKPRQ